MDHSQFGGGGVGSNMVNGVQQRPNGDFNQVPQQQQAPQFQQSPVQKEYTLPGIMQYLQSQFTLIEKNRMINDLEKSSLKLKIVELENERNSLKVQNDRLTNKVSELEKKLEIFENDKEKEKESSDNTSESNSLFRSLTRSNSKKSRNTGNTRQQQQQQSSEEEILGEISTIDVQKLVKAREFLKSATSDIMYLLRAPSLELADPLHLNSKEFFTSINSPELTSNGGLTSEGQDANEYINMDISLAPPFERTKKQKELDLSHVPNQPQESDTETITESSDEESMSFQKQQKKKLVKIMKRSSGGGAIKNGSAFEHNFAINTIFTPTLCKLINQLLFCYSAERGLIKVWSNLETDRALKYTINLPKDIISVFDIQATKDHIFIASDKSVLVYSIADAEKSEQSKPFLEYNETDLDIKNIDVLEDLLLINFGSSIEILQVDSDKKNLIPFFSTNYNNGDILSSKFITSGPNKASKIAMLTQSSLIFQEMVVTSAKSKNEEDIQIIALSQFTDYLLTSRNLIINLTHGIFVMGFHDLNAFKRIPLKEKNISSVTIGCSTDDSSLLFVKSAESGIHVYKMIDTGDILNLKNFENINSSADWCSIGNTGAKYAIVLGSDAGVTFYDI